MTETTEGLTRRSSSGSDSFCACADAVAKKKRATSASHGGSLRFNISGAFFSKKEFGARGMLGSVGEGFNGRNPTAHAAQNLAAFGHYAGSRADVNRFMSKLWQVRFCKGFRQVRKRRRPPLSWERPSRLCVACLSCD